LIKKEILSGKISLLELELNVLFNEMENSVNIYNIEDYSSTYKNVCEILEQKFDELKKLLRTLDDDQKIINYLKKKPKDEEVCSLFNGCWHNIFYIEDLSLDFLIYAKNRFCKDKVSNIEIEHLKRIYSNEEFLIEIPEYQFIEKLDQFFDEIKQKLPCSFEEIFKDENNQIKIYEKFIYSLHLFQQGRVKYHKETNMVYL
jgi:hypothetical protein